MIDSLLGFSLTGYVMYQFTLFGAGFDYMLADVLLAVGAVMIGLKLVQLAIRKVRGAIA